jgi:hypothetical protein
MMRAMDRSRKLALVVAMLLVPTLQVANAQAARSDADVRIGRNASLTGEGQTALVRIRARCEPGWEVLEALVTVSQPQAFGEGSFSLTCDGRWARTNVDVTSLDLPFEPDRATASALLLLTDPETEETSEAQDSVTVRLSDRR